MYRVNEASEAPGTNLYITPEGELNLKVVFKVRTRTGHLHVLRYIPSPIKLLLFI
jgi:hypothetical protein